MVPVEIQSCWLTQVLYPAIIASSNPDTMAYVNYTLDEWTWKAGNNKRFSGTKTTVLDSNKLKDLQKAMNHIIKDNPDELDMFGSFFFVADTRGIKGSTSMVVSEDCNPYKMLCKNYPSMDWEYMMDRQNGQLLMDLGMAFHPDPRDKEPRIGLWRLDKLHASYGAAGMNSGTIHHFNTFSNYGAMQSEMNATRAATVQLSFRSSYNLNFEIVRHPGAEIYFCDVSDAHDMNHTFISCLDGFEKMFMGATQKSYGVREELRGSGAAIKEVLLDAPKVVGISI